jgi:hypothetical protein
MLRLTARQQILIAELIADHVMPTISRLEPGLVSFHLRSSSSATSEARRLGTTLVTHYSKQGGDL